MLCVTGGEKGQAPQHEILGRGFRGAANGHGRSGFSTFGTPVGAALPVSRGPGDRVGLGGFARQHAGHQFERNVYRVGGHAVGRGGW